MWGEGVVLYAMMGKEKTGAGESALKMDVQQVE